MVVNQTLLKQFIALISVIFALMVSGKASADNALKNQLHQHHHDTGTHGIVLMLIDDQLVASHLPFHNSMHEHQIIFTTTVEKKSIKQVKNLLKKHQLVTLFPEKFSLSQLKNKQLPSFKAAVYQGHFERDGKPVLMDVDFAVGQIIYHRKMAKNGEATFANGHYELVQLADNNVLAIHKIADKPSVDHLVWLKAKGDKSNNTEINIKNSELLSRDNLPTASLIWQQSLYVETRDFQ